MQPQPKWIATSVTVLGAVIAAAGAIWGFSTEDQSEAIRYVQDGMALVGAVIVFLRRVFKKDHAPLTMMPKP